MKANLSTVTFLIVTWFGKVKRRMVLLKLSDTGPRVTLVTVLSHGTLQLVGRVPDSVVSRI